MPSVPQSAPRALQRRYLGGLTIAVATILLLTLLAGPAVWPVLLLDVLPVFAVLAAAVGWGAWPAAWLNRAGHRIRQQFLVSTALGLGILSTLTLAAGIFGWLRMLSAWALVGVGIALALARVACLVQRRSTMAPQAPGDATPVLVVVLAALVLALPAAIMLFGATLPPGVLWSGENRAYDVLEYHLQVPREWFDAGRIVFLPHNVYASFPQVMETLYLLLMHLVGDAHAAAIPAQLLHAMCGVLTVFALAAFSPPGWPRVIVALVGGSVPWLAYLGCLAYVELGMLFFTAIAAGLLIEMNKPASDPDGATDVPADPRKWRAIFAAGLCAGLAGGCKYTALALVAAALVLAWFSVQRAAATRRLTHVAVFSLGALLAFSPWLFRNAAFTGNPVYPFAYRCFGGTAWSVEQDEQWARGHRPPDAAATLTGRAQALSTELASPMFGPALCVLALAGLALARTRPAALLGLWSMLIVLGWATLTHMPGRFAVPLIVPLAYLAGMAIQPRPPGPILTPGWVRPVVLLAALAGGIWGNATLVRLLQRDQRWWSAHGVPLATLVGQTLALCDAQPVNRVVPSDGLAWLVGDARAFYLTPRIHPSVVFSRDPWLEYAAHATPAEAVAWLRTQNVTHVVFSWDEIDRLKSTYGFPAVVTRAWVAELASTGLRRVALPPDLAVGPVEIYEVSRPFTAAAADSRSFARML